MIALCLGIVLAQAAPLDFETEPRPIVSGRHRQARITLELPAWLDPDRVVVRASAGAVEGLVRGEGSKVTLTWAPPTTRYPQRVLFAFFDPAMRREAAFLALPLWGAGSLTASTRRGAEMSLLVGGRTFGPVQASGGEVTLDFVSPPEVTSGTWVARDATGERRQEVPLPRPRQHPLVAVVSPTRLVADARSEGTVCALAAPDAVISFVAEGAVFSAPQGRGTRRCAAVRIKRERRAGPLEIIVQAVHPGGGTARQQLALEVELDPRVARAPQLLSPSRGEVVMAGAALIPVTLRWKRAEGVQAWEVELNDSTFGVDSPEISRPLPPGDWQWRVRNLARSGEPGQWSELRALRTEQAAPPPAAPKKAGSALSAGFLRTSAGPGALGYRATPRELPAPAVSFTGWVPAVEGEGAWYLSERLGVRGRVHGATFSLTGDTGPSARRVRAALLSAGAGPGARWRLGPGTGTAQLGYAYERRLQFGTEGGELLPDPIGVHLGYAGAGLRWPLAQMALEASVMGLWGSPGALGGELLVGGSRRAWGNVEVGLRYGFRFNSTRGTGGALRETVHLLALQAAYLTTPGG